MCNLWRSCCVSTPSGRGYYCLSLKMTSHGIQKTATGSRNDQAQFQPRLTARRLLHLRHGAPGDRYRSAPHARPEPFQPDCSCSPFHQILFGASIVTVVGVAKSTCFQSSSRNTSLTRNFANSSSVHGRFQSNIAMSSRNIGQMCETRQTMSGTQVGN